MIKNMKIFPKTFCYTVGILTVVVVLVHAVFYFVFPSIYEKQQLPKLEKSADVLVESLKDKDIKDIRLILDAYSKNVNISAHLKRDVANGIYEIDHDLHIDETGDDQFLFIEERAMRTSDGHDVIVQVVAGRDITNDFLEVIEMSIPVVASIMMVFTLVFSYLYSRRLVSPLEHIGIITKQMEEMDPEARINFNSKDEIAKVGVRVNELYEKLLFVIGDLENKNTQIRKMQNQKLNFLRSISHELKTQLTGLRIMQENMLYNVGKYKNRDEYIEKSINAIDEMSSLIKDILESSKFKEWTENKKENNVREVVNATTEKYYELYTNKKVEIINDIDSEMKILMSEQAIDKLLSNLIGNAIKYSYDSGRVSVYNEKDTLVIENTCKPLTEEQISTIFESVFRGEGKINVAKDSTGLGLYIVKNILESYNLAYSFESYEEGMRFKITEKKEKNPDYHKNNED